MAGYVTAVLNTVCGELLWFLITDLVRFHRIFLLLDSSKLFSFLFRYAKGAFMLNFWGQNQRFQTWLEQNAVASMLIFE